MRMVMNTITNLGKRKHTNKRRCCFRVVSLGINRSQIDKYHGIQRRYHMNKLSTILMTTLIVAGCSSIPSFYDPNESKAIIDISTRVEMMDCDLKPASLKKQIRSIDFYVEWLNQYSLAK